MIGYLFARYAKALAVGRGDHLAAAAFAASQNWLESDKIASILKAAVSAVGTSAMASAIQPVVTDLADYLRAKTIMGRLENLVRVPLRTRFISVTTSPTATWVGEGKPIPVSRADVLGSQLTPLSVAAIAVLTRELVQDSSPQADQLIARLIGDALAEALDRQFIDPTLAGSAGVSPASITNGVTAVVSAGNTAANITGNFQEMVAELVDNDMPLDTAVWIMSPATAVYLAMLRDAGGGPVFPSITAAGGTLAGIPVITSKAAAGEIVLLEAGQIAIGEESADIQFSAQASLQMDDAPADGATTQVSLYQHNLVAIRGIRYANWAARRPGAVVVMTGVGF